MENREEIFKIEGRNPVFEALKSERDIDKIYIQKGEGHKSLGKLIRIAKEKKIPVVETDKRKLDEMSETKAHQGVIAHISPVKYASLDDIVIIAEKKGEPLFVVVLDGIEDPHNLGAVIRTANAAGVHGVIIPKHRSAYITPTVVKTAAGACFYTPVCKVTNLSAAIKRLKDEGVWFYGADMHGEKNLFETDFSGGVGIVIGNEGKGISPVIRKECDFTVNIPMVGQTESLNASVSAGILMYQVLKSRL